MKIYRILFVLLAGVIFANAGYSGEESQTVRIQGLEGIYAREGRAYVVYADAMPGDEWGEKINNAIQRALEGSIAAEVVLPPGHLTIKTPIKFWRQRKIPSKGIDTTAEGIELADLRQVYTGIRGGRRQDLAKGLVLRGAAGRGTTKLFWDGGPNQVVIDMPAPWYCEIRNIEIDGRNTKGLIGIRYRAGWEFGVNGGKSNIFEGITLSNMDVGIQVGDPFGPDLVASSFRDIRLFAVRIGVRAVGANVAEIWFQNIFINKCEEAGFKLITHSGRVVRNLAEKDTPTNENVLRDADGREIFLEQIPEYARKTKVQNIEHADVPGSNRRPWVGGGGPTIVIQNVVSHMNNPKTWLVDSNGAPLRLYGVRHEGPGGIFRTRGGGVAMRFNDILVDVNAVTAGGMNGYVIEYDKYGPLYLVGGTFEGPIALGNNAVVYTMGTKFWNRQRAMSGIIQKGEELPPNSFYKRTGQERTIPNRRWPGELVRSGVHEKIGFVQKPGTSGARVYEMQSVFQTTVRVPEGKVLVTVPLEGLNRQIDVNYQVMVTPGWQAGSVWVAEKKRDGFTVRFDNPAPRGATIDVEVRRPPYRGQPVP